MKNLLIALVFCLVAVSAFANEHDGLQFETSDTFNVKGFSVKPQDDYLIVTGENFKLKIYPDGRVEKQEWVPLKPAGKEETIYYHPSDSLNLPLPTPKF